ncbi:MAG: transposase [Magnetococcales bacterium]|nr:transposase [Magnetococcales bacterium]
MSVKRVTEREMDAALRALKGGTPVGVVAARAGVSEGILERWQRRLPAVAAVDEAELSRVSLEAENRRLRGLVGELSGELQRLVSQLTLS